MRIDMDHLSGWIGRTEVKAERIAPFPANALAATLDREDQPYTEGMALPPLYHWLHFLPVYRISQTNYDGHAKLGGFLPPVPLPRRMWAGSRLQFHAPLQIGAMLRKLSTVKSISHKKGRSGDLIFVTVVHQIFDGERLCTEEEHDIVYREAPDPQMPAPAVIPAPSMDRFSREVVPDPVLLFRYSALTFNGHRIHYDTPFATGTEGYEGLVVHGPLLATLLIDLVRREHPTAVIRGFEFRAKATIFGTKAFSLHGIEEGEGRLQLWAKRADGALAMEAVALLA